MSGFSPEWLALREPVDCRSRNTAVARSLSAYLEAETSIAVVDLGSGTGANLRATAPLLPLRQHWTLFDYDVSLLAAAKRELAAWADNCTLSTDGAVLKKSGRHITVEFRTVDLAHELDSVFGFKPDLVTASAFFDLTSAEFIQRLAMAAARYHAIFYTVLTYNGAQRWMPRLVDDDGMIAAFNRHQTIDKGFGPAAGPEAPGHLADEFWRAGYRVEEGESPWELTSADRSLAEQLAVGMADAVSETNTVDARAIEEWIKSARTAASVGHVDTLALPS
jgi:hypothetical protein